jgi:hypothetical protein
LLSLKLVCRLLLVRFFLGLFSILKMEAASSSGMSVDFRRTISQYTQLFYSRRRRGLGWEDYIKMYLREIRQGGTNWICLAQDRYPCKGHVNTVMNLWVPTIFGNSRVAAVLSTKS